MQSASRLLVAVEIVGILSYSSANDPCWCSQDFGNNHGTCISSSVSTLQAAWCSGEGPNYCLKANYSSVGDVLPLINCSQYQDSVENTRNSTCGGDGCCFTSMSSCQASALDYNKQWSPKVSRSCLVYTVNATIRSFATCETQCNIAPDNFTTEYLTRFPGPMGGKPGICARVSRCPDKNGDFKCCSTLQLKTYSQRRDPDVNPLSICTQPIQCPLNTTAMPTAGIATYADLADQAFTNQQMRTTYVVISEPYDCDGDQYTTPTKLSADDTAAIVVGCLVVAVFGFVCALYSCRTREKLAGQYEKITMQESQLGQHKQRLDVYHTSWHISETDVTMDIKLGQGAFGTVYAGDWLGQLVAIKVIENAMDGNTYASNRSGIDIDSKRFSAEAETMIQLHHPHLVAFFGAGNLGNGNTFLVTELMAKGTLRDMLDSYFATIGWAERMSFCADISSGMLYLHSRTPPLVHRDLKCDNVLVGRNMEIKIADFGTAARLRLEDVHLPVGKEIQRTPTLSKTIPVRGSPLWMAPELLRPNGRHKVSKANDVYSFGCCMYEITSGFLPYQEPDGSYPFRSADELYNLVLSGYRPKIPLRSPKALADLMGECWRQIPEERPVFREVNERLNKMLGSIPGVAASEGPSVTTSIDETRFSHFSE